MMRAARPERSIKDIVWRLDFVSLLTEIVSAINIDNMYLHLEPNEFTI